MDQDLILLDKAQVPQDLEDQEDQVAVVEEDSKVHLHLTMDLEQELLDKVMLEAAVSQTLEQSVAAVAAMEMLDQELITQELVELVVMV